MQHSGLGFVDKIELKNLPDPASHWVSRRETPSRLCHVAAWHIILMSKASESQRQGLSGSS